MKNNKPNKETLADRMKRYEEVTTNINLIERLPIYARVDMRAGHSWCKNLNKPFDIDYSNAMKAATSYIVEKTGAVVGYTQSDEASFVWLDSTKIPFETRLFKLQSIIASMFTGAFIKHCLTTKLNAKILQMIPSFDCRICNMPNLDECANMILWRERDSIKNSITLLALEHFSNNAIYKKNSVDKIEMLNEKGVDYYSLDEDLRNGSYFRRELYNRVLTNDEINAIHENNRPTPNENGEIAVVRSHVVQFKLGMPLNKVSNRKDVLFYGAIPEAIINVNENA